MPLTLARRQASANATIKGSTAPAAITHISLHTADPGTTGTNEVSGGSPAYARLPVTWADADGSANVSATNTPLSFDVPGSTSVSYIGFWTALTGGTFAGSDSFTEETFASQGILDVTSVTVAANNSA